MCAVLALCSCRVYFHEGLPSTHDSENHLARFANFKTALKEGQMPPRFAPNLFHRYGYPVFNYNYPLPNILSVPFSLVKTPYQLTFKILMISSVTLLLLGVWQWLTMLKFRNSAKFLATLSIAVSPYLLQTIIYRGSIGEVMALTGIAWWLVWTEAVKQRGDKIGNKGAWKDYLFSSHTILGGVLLGAFFLAHNVTVLFGTPLMLAFSFWWLQKNSRSLLKVLGAFLIGLGLSVWFWIPALLEQSAIIVGGSSLSKQFLQHFPTFHELLSSPSQFGFSFIGSIDSLSFGVGWVQLVALACFSGWSVAALLRHKVALKNLSQFGIVFFAISLLFLVFQLSFTSTLWQIIPLARYIQFPWRLGLFAILSNAALIAWLVQQRLQWQSGVLSAVLIVQLIIGLRVIPVGYYNKAQIEYDLFEQSTTTSNENLPKDFTFQEFADWQPTPVLLDGKATITVQKWSGSKRTYEVVAESQVIVIEPTMYFPGWETTITSGNSYRLASYLDNKDIAGRIAYTLEPGTYQVHTEFTQNTLPRIVGNISSVITFAFVLGATSWLLYAKLKKLQPTNDNKA